MSETPTGIVQEIKQRATEVAENAKESLPEVEGLLTQGRGHEALQKLAEKKEFDEKVYKAVVDNIRQIMAGDERTLSAGKFDSQIDYVVDHLSILGEALQGSDPFIEGGALAQISFLEQISEKRIKNSVVNLIESNLSVIDQNLMTSQFTYEYFDTFFKFTESQNPTLGTLAIDFLTKHISLLEQKVNEQLEGKNHQSYRNFIFKVIEKGNPDQSREASDEIKKTLDQSVNNPEVRTQSITEIIASLVCNKDENLRLLGEEIIRNKLKEYGLDYDEFKPIWDRSTPDNYEAVNNNFSRIIELERSAPGSSLTLFQEFGIAAFGRYPLNLLLRQYEQRNNNDIPYGIAIYPRDDKLPDGSKVGVFYEARNPLSKFSDQLKGLGIGIRIIECESKIDIARYFIRFDRKYGNTHKIDFAIIAGHGTESSIMFGGYDQDHSLYVEDINPPSENHTIRKTAKFFSPNPTIILSSCSTGKSDAGIAQQLSEALNAEVIAPDSNAKLQMISVSEDNGTPGKNRFDAGYYPATTKRFQNGVKK